MTGILHYEFTLSDLMKTVLYAPFAFEKYVSKKIVANRIVDNVKVMMGFEWLTVMSAQH